MTNRNLVGAILALTALIVHLACFSGLITAHPERLLQVDSLNVSDITRSILAGVPINSWQFPPSPYLFPEIIFHFAIAALSTSVVVAQVVHAYCLSLGFLIAQLALLRYIGGIGLPGWTGFILLTLGNASLGTIVDHSIISPLYHFGTFVGLLFAMLLLDQALLNADRWLRYSLGLLVLSYLLVFSDWIYVGWFVFAALAYVMLIYLWAHVPLRRAAVVFFMLVTSIGVVRTVPYLLPNAFPPQGMSRTGFSDMLQVLSMPLDSIQRWIGLTAEVITDRPLGLVLLVAALLAVGYLHSLQRKRRSVSDIQSARPLRIAVLALLILAVNLFVVANHDQAPVRYLIPVYYLPLALFLTGTIVLIVKLCPQKISYGLIAILLAVGGSQAYAAWTERPTLAEWVGSQFDISCFNQAVEAYDLKNGITDHLQVRQLNLLASGKAKVFQVYGADLTPYWFQSSRYAYPQHFDFAVINNKAKQASGLTRVYYYLNESILEKQAGTPDARVQCLGFDLLIYRQLRTISLETTFCDHVHTPCG